MAKKPVKPESKLLTGVDLIIMFRRQWISGMTDSSFPPCVPSAGWPGREKVLAGL